jgi:phage terminase large subunit GpA-like protein
MDVMLVGCDSGGHYTDEVYKWSRKAGPRWVIPLKGYSDPGKPIANFPRKRNKDHKVYLTMVGTDTAKELLYGRFMIPEDGPGCCHWPVNEDYDKTWFDQATAERKQRKFKKGVAFYVWDAGGRRNEALDCRVYGLVAIRILQQHMGLRLIERVPTEPADIPLAEEIADTQGEPRPPGKRRRVKGRKRPGSWVNYEGKW